MPRSPASSRGSSDADGRSADAEAIELDRPASPRAACATPSRCSTRCLERRGRDARRPHASATCWAWPSSTRSTRSSRRSRPATRCPASRCSTSWSASGRDLVAFADQVVARLRQRLVDRLARPADAGGIPVPRRRPRPRRASADRPRRQPQQRGGLPLPARAGAPRRRHGAAGDRGRRATARPRATADSAPTPARQPAGRRRLRRRPDGRAEPAAGRSPAPPTCPPPADARRGTRRSRRPSSARSRARADRPAAAAAVDAALAGAAPLAGARRRRLAQPGLRAAHRRLPPGRGP